MPYLDFKEEWTDNKLYRKYNLTDDEITFVERTIRKMDQPTNLSTGESKQHKNKQN